jgi:hypothetical protein
MASNMELYRLGIIVFIILPIFIGLILKIFHLIFKKFHFKFEPVHVFILNYFGTMTLNMISAEIISLLIIFPASEDTCLQYLFSLFASMTFSFSILCMQADRFLAIFWSIHYTARVTTTRAVTACSLSLLLATMLAFGMKIFVKNYTSCVFPVIMLKTRPSNIAMDGIPKILAVTATMAVSIYAVIVDRQLEKLEPYPVNLPSNSQRGTSNVRRINSDPHVFIVIDTNNLDSATVVLPPPQRNEDPVASNTSFPDMLKNTAIMNSIYFMFVINFPIYVFLGVANTNCEKDTGGCESYIFICRCLDPLRIIFCFFSLVLSLIRHRKTDF